MPKTLTRPQMGFFRKTKGKRTPPVPREPAAMEMPLSPEERLREHLEDQRVKKGWRENRLTASLKGHDRHTAGVRPRQGTAAPLHHEPTNITGIRGSRSPKLQT